MMQLVSDNNPTFISSRLGHAVLLVIAAAMTGGISLSTIAAPDSESSSTMIILHTNYHNWHDSIVMSNGKVEVVIVPAIGRVMQFKFVGDEEGPIWNNRRLDGQPANGEANDWVNFGGDKTWPSPEAQWPKLRGHSWRPPAAFDSMPVQASIGNDSATLVSPVDPSYGIRTHRKITLIPDKPIMRIETTYEKIQGDPKKVGVWVITQVRDPIGAYLAVPASSIFPNGYNNMAHSLPPSLRFEKGLLSLTRNPKAAYKIGSDAGAVLWVGNKMALLIESPRVAGGEYPDHNSSAEIYTNPDPLQYIEMELLGPLSTMKVGDRIHRSSTYTLFHRSEHSADAEARRILGVQ
jgi:hypothetical protein